MDKAIVGDKIFFAAKSYIIFQRKDDDVYEKSKKSGCDDFDVCHGDEPDRLSADEC